MNTVEIKRHDDGTWDCNCEFLHVFATGHSKQEAIDDFVVQCEYFKDVYASTPEDKCTGLALRLKERWARTTIRRNKR